MVQKNESLADSPVFHGHGTEALVDFNLQPAQLFTPDPFGRTRLIPRGTSDFIFTIKIDLAQACGMGRIRRLRPSKGDYGPEGSKIITPGDPDHSVLLTRMKTRGQRKMPNVATSKVNDEAVETNRQWIESLK